MSITEIIPELGALSRGGEFQLARMLLENLAGGELLRVFQEGQIYPIHTPEYAPHAAAQLAQVLGEEGGAHERGRVVSVPRLKPCFQRSGLDAGPAGPPASLVSLSGVFCHVFEVSFFRAWGLRDSTS